MKNIINISLMITVATWINPVLADVQTMTVPEPVAVTREPANGLPSHTVFRPADLQAYGESELPVVVWANGACRKSHYAYISYLNGLAQAGYIVIAFGAINEIDTQGFTEQPERLVAAMDWVQSERGQQQLSGRADTDLIATAGTSCGGLEALLAAADPRVDAVLGLNTGFFVEQIDRVRSSLEDIDAVTVPTMIAYGGPEDIAAENAIANFNRSMAPFVLVSAHEAGHNGLTYGLWENDPDMGILIESVGLGAAWLDFVLKGDRAAGDKLLLDDCYYCRMDIFTVQSKGFR